MDESSFYWAMDGGVISDIQFMNCKCMFSFSEILSRDCTKVLEHRLSGVERTKLQVNEYPMSHY